jgi:hypothetical protein
MSFPMFQRISNWAARIGITGVSASLRLCPAAARPRALGTADQIYRKTLEIKAGSDFLELSDDELVHVRLRRFAAAG